MFKNESKNEIAYIMPDDHEQAAADCLKNFTLPNIKEVWVKNYGITYQPFADALKALDVKQIPVHVLSDYVQSRSKSGWEIAVDLYHNLKHGDITLTTAGPKSQTTGAIWHHKSYTIHFTDDSEPLNWEGSVNFSPGGWNQGNSARQFNSLQWSNIYIAQFEEVRAWAQKERSDKQVATLLSTPIESMSEDLDESTVDLLDQIANLENQIMILQKKCISLTNNIWVLAAITILIAILFFLKLYNI